MNFQLCFVTEDGRSKPFRNVGIWLSGKHDVDISEYLNIRFYLLIVRLMYEGALDTFYYSNIFFTQDLYFCNECFNFMINLIFHQSMSDSGRSFKPPCRSLLILCMQ